MHPTPSSPFVLMRRSRGRGPGRAPRARVQGATFAASNLRRRRQAPSSRATSAGAGRDNEDDKRRGRTRQNPNGFGPSLKIDGRSEPASLANIPLWSHFAPPVPHPDNPNVGRLQLGWLRTSNQTHAWCGNFTVVVGLPPSAAGELPVTDRDMPGVSAQGGRRHLSMRVGWA